MENLQSFRDNVSPDYFKPNLKGQSRTIFRAMDSCRFLFISPYVIQTNLILPFTRLPLFSRARRGLFYKNLESPRISRSLRNSRGIRLDQSALTIRSLASWSWSWSPSRHFWLVSFHISRDTLVDTSTSKKQFRSCIKQCFWHIWFFM